MKVLTICLLLGFGWLACHAWQEHRRRRILREKQIKSKNYNFKIG